MKNSIGYKETVDSLTIRIDAHKKYSNFSLEDFFNEHLPFKKGDVVLDIGCGSGNFFPVYSEKIGEAGAIVGMDQSPELLSKASKTQCSTPMVLLNLNMNAKLPFISENFNHVISTFAIYYVDEVELICKDMNRILKKSGEVFLVGPTDNNARELYEFNAKIFNFERDEKITKRTNRLEKEFYPKIQAVFGNAVLEKIPCKLLFPEKADFIRYYMATLLFEESVKKAGFIPVADDLMSVDFPAAEISKEMIMIRSKKNE